MNAIESIELSAAANHLNARRMAQIDRRVNAFLSLLLAVAVGLGLAFALIHFGSPCEGASLCAAVLPTQRSWLERIVLDLQRWRLLRHIRSAQQDLTYQQEALQLAQRECDHIPKQLDVTQRHIDQFCRQMHAPDAPKLRP